MTHGGEQLTHDRAPRDGFARTLRPALVLAAGSLALLSGCRQPPIRATDPRSQFDHYDMSRNEQEPAYWFDEYGRRQPNLRGRLLHDD